MTSKNDIKTIEYKQDDSTYIIEKGLKLNNAYLCIKNEDKIDLQISLEEIHKKNRGFKIYQTIQEFINSFEDFIKNKNITIEESKENLILNIIIFNILNGNKENVSFVFNKKENCKKDEVDEMNKKSSNSKETEKIVQTDLFQFTWKENSNCSLFNEGKRIKKIQNQGWNAGIKGTNILKRNEVNIFKIKVNHVNMDKTGLQFGIAN